MTIKKIMLPFHSKLSQYLVVGLTVILLAACQTTADSSSSTKAQQNHHKAYITGDVTEQKLFKDYPYFAKGYQSYQLSQQQVALVKSLPSNISLDVYFGAWCHDSQREVPRLLKALSVNPNITTKLIALDIRKQEPQGRATASGVKYTPTIIVKQDGEEVGRIIERPKTNLVADILSFVRS
ncbi:thioredoxin family protein [Thalassotalea euphylliae]|uniref:Thioredoxin family protein n=1 Tax=Thalassotalea euphylliae TaxID=1655234 RepID=A0A3E0U0B6_9GAMM|nr:thioredoxin family protein [Thalassotalea euphylliae]REL30356.1 thioredoxin family protein [Thalassotalea euphylliae]